MIFSPDSKHFVYTAQKNNKTLLVFDGEEKELPTYVNYIGNLTFSPNSQRFAYLAYDEEENKFFVVVDGKEGKRYDGVENKDKQTILFSEDSNHFAYIAFENEDMFVVVDEREGKRYKRIDYSLDPFFYNNKLVYIYTENVYTININKPKSILSYLVIDEQKYPNIINSELIFSPDKTQFAYRSIKDMKNFKEIIILNGREIGKAYTHISELTFSPNSKNLIYIGETDDEEFLVINGEEIEGYDEFIPYRSWKTNKFYEFFTFSSDGKKLTYIVRKGNQIWQITRELE